MAHIAEEHRLCTINLGQRFRSLALLLIRTSIRDRRCDLCRQ